MADLSLKFSSSTALDTGSFRLLELPSDLSKAVESALLSIKGDPDEDAVLCTGDKTYTLRSIVLSNSVLVVTPSQEDDGNSSDVVIRDQIHEVLELVSSVPRLHKLDSLLRGREYEEGRDEEEDIEMADMGENRSSQHVRLSYVDARNVLQTSDSELDRYLRDRRVLDLDGELRPIVPSYLTTILELILTNLVSLSLSHDAVPADTLESALEGGHDVRRDVARQVMGWFGILANGMWKMDAQAIVREVGLGILRPHRDDPIAQDAFLARWRTAVGDTFAAHVSLALLAGNYLSSTDSTRDPPLTTLTYLPCSQLPTDPAARFGDLFRARARWRAEEIAPFLADVAVDAKERDRLLLKYTRAVPGEGGVWYSARGR
ncbi:hypothetical protein WOLCODRAFT_121994 [Wolfiporia cocos MD-104 SS10]|uniref:Sister chromatid cohesion protein Dcc1 n=1 Tax=Wolfiporia cocos (strain MD-104) TaxID=742152 RepID=A0A2H3JU36_WOLCO|nr:hypothetical protein WOLCODRAFT_121994 [Wolfiporia cocos MD-104 SS10]